MKGEAELAATVSTAVITVVVLIFGEITPKSLAKDFPEKFAMFSAPIIRFFIGILWVLNAAFSAWKKLISKAIKKNEEDDKMSQEELLMFVEEVEQEGTIDKNESNLLRNAIEFTERRADDMILVYASCYTDDASSCIRIPVWSSQSDKCRNKIHTAAIWDTRSNFLGLSSKANESQAVS